MALLWSVLLATRNSLVVLEAKPAAMSDLQTSFWKAVCFILYIILLFIYGFRTSETYSLVIVRMWRKPKQCGNVTLWILSCDSCKHDFLECVYSMLGYPVSGKRCCHLKGKRNKIRYGIMPNYVIATSKWCQFIQFRISSDS